MDILRDRYSLMALSVILMIAVVCMTDAGGPERDDGRTGVICDVRITANGNTFDLVDSAGNTVRCFSSQTVKEGDACSVTGTYSDDGSIFFVSRISFI